MSQPPGPNPYGDQPGQPPEQNPYGQGPPQQPPYSQPGYPGHPGGLQPGYPQPGFPQGGHQQPGYQQQPGYPAPYGYQGQPGVLPGMPPFASWGARLGALLLDWLMFLLIPTGLVAAGYGQYVSKVIDAWNDCDDQGVSQSNCPTPHMASGPQTLILIGSLLSLLVTLYLAYREGKTGQTPGKKIVGIRLLRESDGSALGFGMAFGRRLLHILDYLPCYLGFLWPLWDAKNQTFADKCVSTVVVKDQL